MQSCILRPVGHQEKRLEFQACDTIILIGRKAVYFLTLFFFVCAKMFFFCLHNISFYLSTIPIRNWMCIQNMQFTIKKNQHRAVWYYQRIHYMLPQKSHIRISYSLKTVTIYKLYIHFFSSPMTIYLLFFLSITKTNLLFCINVTMLYFHC